MSDQETSESFEDVDQVLAELEKVVFKEYHTQDYEAIDDALRTWLQLASLCRKDFYDSLIDPGMCSRLLPKTNLFRANPDYVRKQIIHSFLQEDDPDEDDLETLFAIASCLLQDGRENEETFRQMIEEGCFTRLLRLLNGGKDRDPGLHRLLLELCYAMTRGERLDFDDLARVEDDFIIYLFQLIEGHSDDASDPFHYAIIRVLLVLNEQYMVASATAMNDPDSPDAPLTNRVVKCVSQHGADYKVFGENLILILNRETETSLQLLILKLLYLLFTTKATYEYFYTNDLRVLVDVIIRNLMDLPNEVASLRHTYLRVLYPLLAHTQLNQHHYKKVELQRTLKVLAGSGHAHFAPTDETTLRLVDRVAKVPWLVEDPTEDAAPGGLARKLLGISLSSNDAASNVSVVDVAAVHEKPGVQTPSLKAESEADGQKTVTVVEAHMTTVEAPQPARAKNPPPAVPKHRHGTPVGAPSPAKKIPPQAPPPRRQRRTRLASSSAEGAASSTEHGT
ncbi:hypothetical protein F4780DRAFT_773276 [Xylariomycetidae sp. FL0641]|nr:hypothetical protein F4780DRAFT_773276 [Xylariomycetidae sp. FL0641]